MLFNCPKTPRSRGCMWLVIAGPCRSLCGSIHYLLASLIPLHAKHVRWADACKV